MNLDSLTHKEFNKESEKDKNLKGDEMTESDLIKIKRAYSKVLVSGTCDIDWKTPPLTQDDPGNEGDIAYDDDFVYIYINGRWVRQSLSGWQPTP